MHAEPHAQRIENAGKRRAKWRLAAPRAAGRAIYLYCRAGPVTLSDPSGLDGQSPGLLQLIQSVQPAAPPPTQQALKHGVSLTTGNGTFSVGTTPTLTAEKPVGFTPLSPTEMFPRTGFHSAPTDAEIYNNAMGILRASDPGPDPSLKDPGVGILSADDYHSSEGQEATQRLERPKNETFDAIATGLGVVAAIGANIALASVAPGAALALDLFGLAQAGGDNDPHILNAIGVATGVGNAAARLGGSSTPTLRSTIEAHTEESLAGKEVFLHGTTEHAAENFRWRPGEPLFTATDPKVARFFAQRTVDKVGGEIGGVALVLPGDIVKQLKSLKLLKVKPVDDMPEFLEWVFKPGAQEFVERSGDIIKLPKGTL